MNAKIQKIKLLFVGAIAIFAIFITTTSLEFRSRQFASSSWLARKTEEASYRVSYAFHGAPLTSLRALVSNSTAPVDAPLVFDNTKAAYAMPALVYHGIVKNADRFSMTIETFKEQMEALKKDGWSTVSIEDFTAFIKGEKTLPDKSFLLTFDDGRKDSFQKADPLLRALGFKAVMFTPSTLYQNKSIYSYYMSTADLAAMSRSPVWEIESHAIQQEGGFVKTDAVGNEDNFLSNRAWLPKENRLETKAEYQTRVTSELRDSQSTITQGSGKEVTAFSYPFGDFGQQSTNASDTATQSIRQAVLSYQVAFRQIWPLDDDYSQNYPGDDRYRAKRIEPSPTWSGEKLATLLDSGRAKPIPYSAAINPNEGWKVNWGAMDVAEGSYTTYAKSTTQGSFTFLDGTRPWKDFNYKAVIDWEAGSHVSLIARYDVPAQYFACTYSDDYVRAEATYDGKTEVFKEFKLTKAFDKKDLMLSMDITDSGISCYANGTLTAHDTLEVRRIKRGGVGIKTWDEKLGVARVTVKSVSVEAITK